MITVGKITGWYGIQGWVKVYSYTKPITNILTYSPWQLCQQGQWQTVTVAEGRMQGKGLVARFESCQDRDQAARFLGAEIAIQRDQLPSTEAGEYYWTDLVGLTVINTEGITLGQIDHLLETGANDVLVVKGTQERLIPFLLERVVLEIDLSKRLMRVDWEIDF
jgi:16S rRNA processing protein RimM